MLKISRRGSVLLLVLLVLAFVLRFYRLGLDSFWLDELYVANEADPHQSLNSLFQALKTQDQHPPLFYIVERCFFYFFGESECLARMIPATAGVAGVFAIYLLGREILDERLGLIAAALTCVNHFAIYYSREARGYMFAFLFSTLSLVYFTRLVKRLRSKDTWVFALVALLTMYSHYFGVLLVFAEFCSASLLILNVENKPLFARRFLLSGLLIVAGYSVWFPVLMSFGKMRSFWIEPLSGDWLLRFFGHYFGDIPGLAFVMAALLAVYLAGVFTHRTGRWPATDRSSLAKSWVILGVPTLVCYVVPYIRGLIVTPMLTDRYTIVVLPCLLVFIAYGIGMIPSRPARYALVGFLLCFSLAGEIGFVGTWTKPHKTQFREVTAFMAADPRANHFPILTDRVAPFESYYVRKLNYPGPLLDGPRAKVIDGIMKTSSSWGKIDGFWLMDAHSAGDPDNWLDTTTRRKVDSMFVKVKDGRFLDAWAQLYVRRP